MNTDSRNNLVPEAAKVAQDVADRGPGKVTRREMAAIAVVVRELSNNPSSAIDAWADEFTVTDNRISSGRPPGNTDSRNAPCFKCGKTVAADQPLYRIGRHWQPTVGLCEDCTRAGAYWRAWDARRWIGHPFHRTPAEWGTEQERADKVASLARFGMESDGLCRCACPAYQLEDPYWAELFRLSQVSDGDLHSKCHGCGRTLGRTDFNPARTCSPECARKAHNARRRADPAQVECEVCGDTFTPPRADARYCSGRCRQKAYRDRASRSCGRPAD